MSVGCDERLHERLPATAESIAPLRHAVVQFAGHRGASERQLDDIALAVTEAVANAVVHAYVGEPAPGVVEVRARVRERRMEVVVCDEGIGMQPRADSPGLGLGLALIVKVTERFDVESPAATPGVRVRMIFGIG